MGGALFGPVLCRKLTGHGRTGKNKAGIPAHPQVRATCSLQRKTTVRTGGKKYRKRLWRVIRLKGTTSIFFLFTALTSLWQHLSLPVPRWKTETLVNDRELKTNTSITVRFTFREKRHSSSSWVARRNTFETHFQVKDYRNDPWKYSLDKKWYMANKTLPRSAVSTRVMDIPLCFSDAEAFLTSNQ